MLFNIMTSGANLPLQFTNVPNKIERLFLASLSALSNACGQGQKPTQVGNSFRCSTPDLERLAGTNTLAFFRKIHKLRPDKKSCRIGPGRPNLNLF